MVFEFTEIIYVVFAVTWIGLARFVVCHPEPVSFTKGAEASNCPEADQTLAMRSRSEH